MMSNKMMYFSGAGYFALLGLANLILTAINGAVGIFDVLVLGFLGLPLLFPKKWLLLSFGMLSAFIALVIGIACLQFHLAPNVSNHWVDFMMGYLISVSMLVASVLLIGSSLSHTPRTFRLARFVTFNRAARHAC